MIKYLLGLVWLLNLNQAVVLAQKKNELTFAFGSCNRQDLPQPLWNVIMEDRPHLWIWLGDNIYGDSDDLAVLKVKYDKQLNQEDYKKLIEKVPVIGTWDDHDYGRNDGNRTYPFRKESQQLALDFLGEPVRSPRRKQEGIYAAYDYRVGSKEIRVILLDVRYHQDPLQKDAQRAYIPDPRADILGEAQWEWLEAQLRDSQADVHLIGSGIQFIPDQHSTEKWANFPVSLERFFDLLAATRAKGVMLISGDRHIGEFSKIQVEGLDYPVYEFTSSGLTHSSTHDRANVNRYRIGPLVTLKNYGLFRFYKKGRRLRAEVSLKGEQGVIFHTEKITIR